VLSVKNKKSSFKIIILPSILPPPRLSWPGRQDNSTLPAPFQCHY